MGGFYVIISDRIQSNPGSISKFYALDDVWDGVGTEVETVLCMDEMTARNNGGADDVQNPAVLDKPLDANMYWQGSIPRDGDAQWAPVEYGTVYSIYVVPVHLNGEIQSNEITGTIRFEDFMCDTLYNADVCCDANPPRHCDDYNLNNCGFVYNPPRLYSDAAKSACGWNSWSAAQRDAPQYPTFPTDRRALDASRSLLQDPSCLDPLSFDKVTAGGADEIVSRTTNEHTFTGIEEGQCCHVAVVATTPNCESYDITECCADIVYTPNPTVTPTCDCPEPPEVNCNPGGGAFSLEIEVTCPTGFDCDTEIYCPGIPSLSPTYVPTNFEFSDLGRIFVEGTDCVFDKTVGWQMPDNAADSLDELWGFYVVISDRAGNGEISKYYALNDVWLGGDVTDIDIVLCFDEMTNTDNVAVEDKPHSDGLYWSGSIPVGGSTEWTPPEYGTVYSITVNPVHISGEIQADASTGTFRFSDFMCDTYNVDVCCDANPPSGCDDYNLNNCGFVYNPPRMYSDDAKGACGWNTWSTAQSDQEQYPTFPTRRVLGL